MREDGTRAGGPTIEGESLGSGSRGDPRLSYRRRATDKVARRMSAIDALKLVLLTIIIVLVISAAAWGNYQMVREVQRLRAELVSARQDREGISERIDDVEVTAAEAKKEAKAKSKPVIIHNRIAVPTPLTVVAVTPTPDFMAYPTPVPRPRGLLNW